MKKTSSFLLGLFFGIIVAAVISNGRSGGESIKRDTLTVHDTLVYETPVMVSDTVVRRDTVKVAVAPRPAENTEQPLQTDEATQGDSVMAVLPIEQKHYSDTMYDAWVSGYRPVLDSLRVYPTTLVVTETIQKKPRRWGVGAVAGVGVGAQSHKVEPYIGVGIYYRIW